MRLACAHQAQTLSGSKDRDSSISSDFAQEHCVLVNSGADYKDAMAGAIDARISEETFCIFS
jgi:hypothetical protein